MKNDFKIISFDADDTLWINETYYQDIEKEFIIMMSKYRNVEFVTDEIHKTEIDNLEIYGYGAKGFILSMIETALRIAKDDIKAGDIDRIVEMGRELINKPIVLLDGVEDILQKLTDAGYKLIVATKGDLLDQERKLRKSGLNQYFDHIEIMSYKTEEEYQKLIGHLGIKPEDFLMIGNSMKSDIIPILNIGGYGIHIPFHTTWAHEMVEEEIEQSNFQKTSYISEVAAILELKKKHKLFVLGDSISIQYGPYLKGKLTEYFIYDRKKGIEQALADLEKPVGANGGDSRQVLAYLSEESEKDIQYDVLLLNCGLHDLRVDVLTGNHQVEPEEYRSNLNEIIEIAGKISKKIIWVESTPIIDEIHNSMSKGMQRFEADVNLYNKIANGIMVGNNIDAIKLHDFTLNLGPKAFYDHAHFTEEARKLQAEFIAMQLISGLLNRNFIPTDNLPSREDLIKAGYPHGMATPGIPIGNRSIEWKRSNPDIVLYKPKGDNFYDNDNEHFLVFSAPKSDELMSVWTQSSCEARGDNHLVIARSSDGINWSEPDYLTGAKPGTDGKQASWGFPVVSKKGRIYIFFTREIDVFDNNRQGSGAMGSIYSDDNGYNWILGEDIPMPRSKYDNPDSIYPKNWIVWQMPVRDSKDKYITGYTLVTSAVLKPQPKMMWVNADSHSYFMRFENIDDNPEPKDIQITWLPNDDKGLGSKNIKHPDISTNQEPSLVLLPDGRLFATMRTMTGYICYSVSEDDGETWKEPEILRYSDTGEGIKHPLSPCPIYRMNNGQFILLFHNNDGKYGEFSQFKDNWDHNEANFLRNPTYISIGTFKENAYQPIWFNKPYKLFDTDDIAIGPKRTAEIATYTSFIEWHGKRILWYPDRKFYLLGKYISDELLETLKT